MMTPAASGDSSILSEKMSENIIDRSSHQDFLDHRNFEVVQRYWSYLLSLPPASPYFPPFITGDEDYGMTNLQNMHAISVESGEFQSKDSKFQHRHTYVLTLGYDGSQYHGYQQQKGVEHIRTVEDDIEFLLHRKVSAAGRTDKDVSAICQIISFTSYAEQEKTVDGKDINAENIFK